MTAQPEFQSPGASSEQRGRSIVRRRLLIAFVALVALAGGVVAVIIVLRAIGAAAFSSMVTDTSTLAPAQIESIGDFKFPPGAQSIRSRYVSWLDFTMQVGFTLPPAELDALLRTVQIPQPLSTTEIPPQMLQADGWWNPGVPSSFEAGSNFPAYPVMVDDVAPEKTATSRPEIRRSILIDKSNPQLYKVWIHVSG